MQIKLGKNYMFTKMARTFHVIKIFTILYVRKTWTIRQFHLHNLIEEFRQYFSSLFLSTPSMCIE